MADFELALSISFPYFIYLYLYLLGLTSWLTARLLMGESQNPIINGSIVVKQDVGGVEAVEDKINGRYIMEKQKI